MRKHFKIILIMSAFLTAGFLYPAGFNQDYSRSGNVVSASSQTFEQQAGTSQGTVKRYADISSPWSGAYLYENMRVVGSAEINETFTMGKPPSSRSDKDNFFDHRDGAGTGSSTGSSSASENKPESGTDSQAYSGDKENSGTSAQKKSVSGVEEVLGVNIVAVPTWFDLF